MNVNQVELYKDWRKKCMVNVQPNLFTFLLLYFFTFKLWQI